MKMAGQYRKDAMFLEHLVHGQPAGPVIPERLMEKDYGPGCLAVLVEIIFQPLLLFLGYSGKEGVAPAGIGVQILLGIEGYEMVATMVKAVIQAVCGLWHDRGNEFLKERFPAPIRGVGNPLRRIDIVITGRHIPRFVQP